MAQAVSKRNWTVNNISHPTTEAVPPLMSEMPAGQPVRCKRPLNNSKSLLVLAIFCALPMAVVVLYSFSPEEYEFYPKCFFYVVTGLHCPGCGATRALFALLHGEWEQAMAYNALFVLLLPWLGWLGVRATANLVFGVPFRRGRWADRVFVGAAIAFVVFGVLRNIDYWPLFMLAPHKL
jgi:hypothetical protein